MTGPGAPPGWYPDPGGVGWLRYFDGSSWTDHRVPVPPPPYPGFVPWTPPWKGAQLGRPAAGPGALAEPGRRLAARLLDGLVLLAVFAACAVVAIVLIAPHAGPIFPKVPQNTTARQPTPGIVWIWLALIGVGVFTSIVAVAYETIATVRYGRTLGKAWLGIRPVRLEGSALAWPRALGRAALYVGISYLGWIGLLDSLWCLWDPVRQCLHDKGAGTIVINDPDPHGAEPRPAAHVTSGSVWPDSGDVGAGTPAGTSAWAPAGAPAWTAGGPPAWTAGAAPAWTPGAAPAWTAAPGPPPTGTNGLAIASFVCALAGLVLLCVPSIVGVVLGLVARGQIRSRGGTQGGAGLALAGIIVGSAVVLFYVAILVIPPLVGTHH